MEERSEGARGRSEGVRGRSVEVVKVRGIMEGEKVQRVGEGEGERCGVV